MKNLIEKLNRLRTGVHVPKSQYNKFGGYKYRSLEDILAATKDALAKEGLLLTISDEIVNVDGWRYVKATATVTDGEHSAVFTGWAREQETRKGMDAAQITGAASSYARKYALNAAFVLDDVADPDAQKPPATQKSQAPRKPAAQLPVLDLDKNEQAAAALDAFIEKGLSSAQILRKFASKYQIDEKTQQYIQQVAGGACKASGVQND